MRIGILILAIIGVLGCNEATQKQYTFSKDVAPIIWNNCAECHRNGGAGPFALTDYQKVFRKKKTIAKVVASGYMPPWPADRSYSHFVGERFLTDQQKEIIQQWVEQGAPVGVKKEIPPLPDFNELSALGKPDKTIFLDSIGLEGNNRDKFLIVKIPFQLPSDTFLSAIEFVPGNNQLVHHMNGHLLTYNDSLKQNPFDGQRVVNLDTGNYQDFIAAFNSLKLYNDDGSKPRRIHSAVNYLPGAKGTIYPEGIGGFTVNKKGAIVANDLHYGPVPNPYWDRSHINLFYSATPPKRPVKEIMMGTNGVTPINPPLQIPPDTIMTFETRAKVPEDISILTINPHMHLLGYKFKAFGITPLGDTIPLIHIPRWDFRWQYFYTFKHMVKVMKGTELVVQATFDNTANNPYNPFDPPQWVGERLDKGGASMRTTDEMFQFIITWLPYQEGDENISLEPEMK